MDIKTLRYFLAVAREQNMTAAAEVLHVTQPTLSRAMADLEKECGRQLFYRTNKNTFLNDDGMYLREKAEKVVADFDDIEQEIHYHTDELHGQVKIGTEAVTNNRLLMKAVAEMHSLYPKVYFMMFSGNTDYLERCVRHDDLDFSFVYDPVNAHEFDIFSLKDTAKFCLLMNKADEYAKQDVLTIEDLKNIPIIVQHDRYDVLNRQILTDEKSYQIIGDYNEVSIAAAMVEAGVCSALTFDNMIDTSGSSSLVLVPIKDAPPVSMSLIWKKHHELSKQAKAMLHLIKQNSESSLN